MYTASSHLVGLLSVNNSRYSNSMFNNITTHSRTRSNFNIAVVNEFISMTEQFTNASEVYSYEKRIVETQKRLQGVLCSGLLQEN